MSRNAQAHHVKCVPALSGEHTLLHSICEKHKSEGCDMQVGNKDVLNCYYAHAEDSLQVGSETSAGRLPRLCLQA